MRMLSLFDFRGEKKKKKNENSIAIQIRKRDSISFNKRTRSPCFSTFSFDHRENVPKRRMKRHPQ